MVVVCYSFLRQLRESYFPQEGLLASSRQCKLPASCEEQTATATVEASATHWQDTGGGRSEASAQEGVLWLSKQRCE